RRHTRSKRDWSSDVCSSDLVFTVAQHWVLQRASRCKTVHHVRHLVCIRCCCINLGLRLGNARSCNQLLRLGDLLSRVYGPDTVAQFAKICHVVSLLPAKFLFSQCESVPGG